MVDQDVRKGGAVPEHLQHRLSKIHVLSHAEVKRLFGVITSLRDRAIFLVAYRHGLRATEVSQLETNDLDFSNTTMKIRRINGGRHDLHPLQKDEALAIKRYLNTRTDRSVIVFLGSRNEAISRRGLDWLMKHYGQEAKLPKAKQHFHTLKHSVAVHLLSAGSDLTYVHDWLGHTALQSSAVYLYLLPAAPKQGFFHPKLPGPPE